MRSLLAIIAFVSPQITSTQSVDDGNALRDSAERLLQRSTTVSTDSQSRMLIQRANDLATEFAKRWHDPFLIQRVSVFRKRSPEERKQVMAAEALRLKGNIELERSGVSIAMSYWRKSLALSRSMHDSSIMAASLVSIGGGLFRIGDYDSAALYVQRGLAIAIRNGDLKTRGNGTGILASIARENGRTAEAMRLYALAMRLRRKTGDMRGVAADLNNIALIARTEGDYDKAIESLHTALDINRSARRNAQVAMNLSNLAGVEFDRGNLWRADSLFRSALSIGAGNDAEVAFVIADHARVQQQLGQLDAAEAGFRKSIDLLGKTGYTSEAVSIRTELASVLAALGNAGEAISVLNTGSKIAQRTQLTGQARSTLQAGYADLAIKMGNYRAADSLLAVIRASSQADSSPPIMGQMLYSASTIAFVQGNYEKALELAERARRIAELNRDKSHLAAVRLMIGAARHRIGISDYRQVIDSVIRDARSRNDLLTAAAGYGVIGDALLGSQPQLAERNYRLGLSLAPGSKSVELNWQLGTGLAVAIAAQGRIDEAATFLKQAIARMERSAAEPGQRPFRYALFHDKWDIYIDLAFLELRAGRLDAAFQVSESMRARQLVEFLAGTNRKSSVAVTSSDLRRSIAKDEVVIEYLLGDSISTAFVVDAGRISAIELPITRAEAAHLADFARRLTTGDGKSRWDPPLRRMYRELIQPIEARGLFAGKRHLVIIPHAELNYASFASFMTASGSYLIDRFEISYAPSAAAWMQLRGRRIASGPVHGFAPSVQRLPRTKDEMESLREIFGNRAVVAQGSAATSDAFRKAVDSSSILHLATFGIINPVNPKYSYVEFSPSRNGTSQVRVKDVLEYNLKGQLVVLSACETGMSAGAYNPVPAGEDWVGFMQSFLERGASSVIASLWPVDDKATSLLMQAFYRHLRGGSSATVSLADAQRELRKTSKYSSPYFWAAFTVNGQYSWR